MIQLPFVCYTSHGGISDINLGPRGMPVCFKTTKSMSDSLAYLKRISWQPFCQGAAAATAACQYRTRRRAAGEVTQALGN